MRTIRASAPGKLVLSGDFAVLRNAPAVVLAVDRRAEVTIDPAEGTDYGFTAPGLVDQRRGFAIEGDQVRWIDGDVGDPQLLVEAVLKQFAGSMPPPCNIEIDTRRFFDRASAGKLGLGGSAAAIVALVRALQPPGTTVEDTCRIARDAHSALQDGLGSGLDIAASCHGGVLEFRRDTPSSAHKLCWPDELAMRVYFSGKPASTTDAIRVAEAGADDAWHRLMDAAELTASAWRDGGCRGILTAMQDYAKALADFDEALDVGIFAGGHDRVAEAAATAGIMYKPSGAGGGDVGFALSDDPARLTEFDANASGLGFVPLDVQRDNTGV